MFEPVWNQLSGEFKPADRHNPVTGSRRPEVEEDRSAAAADDDDNENDELLLFLNDTCRIRLPSW